MSTTEEVKDAATSQIASVTELTTIQTTGKEQEQTAAISTAAISTAVENGDTTDEPKAKRGLRFWLVYVALCLSLLLAALDLVCLSRNPRILSN